MLIEAFKTLSETENTQVLLTTHSPQIVKMLDLKNLKVIRKKEDKNPYITNAEQLVFPYQSLNEVNYVAFDYVSEEYHNELYGYLMTLEDYRGVKDFDNRFFVQRKRENTNKPWKDEPNQITIHTWIRNQIHHPEAFHNTTRYTERELKESIEFMRQSILDNNQS